MVMETEKPYRLTVEERREVEALRQPGEFQRSAAVLAVLVSPDCSGRAAVAGVAYLVGIKPSKIREYLHDAPPPWKAGRATPPRRFEKGALAWDSKYRGR